MSTHLVVGATGGIGRATVKALTARGKSVRVVVPTERRPRHT